MADNPLDDRAAKLKALFMNTIKLIKPDEAPSDETLKEIDPQLDIAARAIVEAFDILNS